MGTNTLVLVCICQAKHECPWYNKYVPHGLITYMCEKLLARFMSAFILGFVNFDSGHWKKRKNNDKGLLC